MRPSIKAALVGVAAFVVLAVQSGALAGQGAVQGVQPPAHAPAAAGGDPAPSAQAAPTPPAAPSPVQVATAALTAAPSILTQLQNQAPETSDDGRLARMGAEAAAIEAEAETVVAAENHQLLVLNRAIKRVTPPGHRSGTASERQARATLQAQQTSLEAQLKDAQAVASAASYTLSLAAERRRESFSARVLERSDSPFSPQFWTSLADAIGPDLDRVNSMALSAVDTALAAAEPRGGLSLGLALALAVVLLWPVRRALERLGHRKTKRPLGHESLRLTTHALWIAVVDVGLPTLAAIALHLGAQWGGLLSPKADALAGAGVVAVTWASAILALGRALATDLDADRRLVRLPDYAANRIQAFLWAVSIITAIGFLLARLNYVVGASVAATIATNCVLSLAYAGVAGSILISLGRGRAPTEAELAAEMTSSPAWTLASLALAIAVVTTVGAVFAGYTTLAVLISGQIFWLSVVVAATYLLLRFIDDLANALFREHGWAAKTLFALFGLRSSTIGQAGVLTSAGLQLIVLMGALSLALTPFGRSGDLLLAHFAELGRTIHIGSATISPEAVAVGLVTLVVGMAMVNFLRGWMVRRYLPVTNWDAGLRNSVITGVGYVGVGLTFICALGAMGLGFKQIALIASALSVGIGFGLQQVVQNFVSGVILLVERPVKVGDWVNVGGVEGDVRRIRVRATEIQTFDRSTVIVPNSDLITKQVQNKTLGDPRGRIQLQLSIANPADARRANELILTTAAANAKVLKDPAPAVFIDSVASAGAVNFNCYLYVANPRDVYRVRSDLYFEIIDIFQQNSLPFVGAT